MLTLITYDLANEVDDEALVAEIKSLGSCTRLNKSVWLVDTVETPAAIRGSLRAVTTKASFFVVRLTQNWAAHAVKDEAADWLGSRTRTGTELGPGEGPRNLRPPISSA